MNRWSAGWAAALLLTLACAAQDKADAPKEEYVKAHYTKYEYRIPMRDGVRLFTSVYVPKDQSQAWPFMVDRTPYSVAPYGEDQYAKHLGPSDEFETAGYIFVYQDVRGRYLSEGKWIEMTPALDQRRSKSDVDESTDMSDTVDWLLAHVPNNNGKVGIWGISYPGFYTAASIIDSNPAIKAASPQAPVTNLFRGDDSYHNGVFMLAANFGFYGQYFQPFAEPATPAQLSKDHFEMGTPDAYEFFLKQTPISLLDTQALKGANPLFADQLYHTTLDSYWKPRDLSQHMHNVHCAVLTVGGWFDAEDLHGPWLTWRAIAKANPETPSTIVEGPWFHGGWARGDGERLGDVQFGAKTAEFFRQQIQFPFFEHYLKGKGELPPTAYMFETGTNVWRKYPSWPPPTAQAKTLYFHSGGKLSFEAPSGSVGNGASDHDEYVSDPMHPVPFVGYVTDTIPQRYMVDDQRFAATRPDVLVYATDPLTEDVTIAGPITAKLKVASSGTDSDYVVKLIDVYPNDYPDAEESNARRTGPPLVVLGDYQQLLRGEPMRAKFRNGFEKPEPLTPGKVTPIEFEMPDLDHTFRKGHRIMVQVQSTWFPLTDRNPQTFTDIPHARPEEFRKATEQVYRSAAEASGVQVMVLPQP
jgi:uncharacterized protein